MGKELVRPDSDIEVYRESAPIADDSLVAIAKMAEARIDAVIKIKQLALKVTNAADWSDQQGKPYLQASGSEKIANLFNISWGFLTPEPLYEQDPDGHYTYTFQGRFSMGSRSIEVEGSRSSKDPFFRQYSGQGSERKERPIADRDNKRDVKMAALTNMLGNGITRILGIRNLTWADLEEFAKIKRDDVGKVEYKTAPKPPQEKGSGTSNGEEPHITQNQGKLLYALCSSKGMSKDIMNMNFQSWYKCEMFKLPKSKFEEAKIRIEALPHPEGGKGESELPL